MKVNFSIDFILGSGNETKDGKTTNKICSKQHTRHGTPEPSNWIQPNFVDSGVVDYFIPPHEERMNFMSSSFLTFFPFHCHSNCFGGFYPGSNFYQHFVSCDLNHPYFPDEYKNNRFVSTPPANHSRPTRFKSNLKNTEANFPLYEDKTKDLSNTRKNDHTNKSKIKACYV